MTSPRAPLIGLPTLRLSSWASSSLLLLMRSASLASERPRLPAAQFAQPLRSSNAARAAATARSTSSGPPWGAVAIDLAVGRIDDVEGVALGGLDGLAADDHPGGGRVRSGRGGLRFRRHRDVLGWVASRGRRRSMIRRSPSAAVHVAPQAAQDPGHLRRRHAHPLERMPGQLEGDLRLRVGHAEGPVHPDNGTPDPHRGDGRRAGEPQGPRGADEPPPGPHER